MPAQPFIKPFDIFSFFIFFFIFIFRFFIFILVIITNEVVIPLLRCCRFVINIEIGSFRHFLLSCKFAYFICHFQCISKYDYFFMICLFGSRFSFISGTLMHVFIFIFIHSARNKKEKTKKIVCNLQRSIPSRQTLKVMNPNIMKKVFKLISIDSKSRAIIHNENIDIFNFAPDVPRSPA